MAQPRDDAVDGCAALRDDLVTEPGAPEEMIIVVEAADLDDARRFIDEEPYHRHGGFSAVRVRPWSQVLPELVPGASERTYAAERGQAG